MTPVPALHDLVAAARLRLRDAGIPPDEADLDARLLAQSVLGWDAARLITAGPEAPPPHFARAYEAFVARRVAREPLAYITGRQEFWGLDIQVSPAVLIPRPETEIIVETVCDLFPAPDEGFFAADVCTGSGCVAVAIARERPAARFVATDLSKEALDVARTNANRLGVANRIAFVATDLLAAAAGVFDLIVANPPYVPVVERQILQPEVRDYEPGIALYAGDDGLDVVRRLIGEAAPRLRTGGLLVFEIGARQGDAAAALISRARDLTLVDIRRDLQGIPRTVVARRR